MTKTPPALVTLVILLSVGGCSAANLGPGGPESLEEPAAPGSDEQNAIQERAVNSVWDGVYTEAQAQRGKAAYLDECSRCHKEDLRGEEMVPGLVGVAFSFRWRGESVQDIFASVQTTMPPDAPGALSDQGYLDVVAYLLAANHYPAGEEELELDPTALAGIAIRGNPP